MSEPGNSRAAFIEAGVGHGSLQTAAAVLAEHPELAASDIHTAAILGDAAGVRRFLALDPANATTRAEPLGWDALTHLCFSRFLRLDRARSGGFVEAARALLDAGASANTGYHERAHQPAPAWEAVLYGAAGLAHHAELTRLLLERGADPNDDETVYHAPESYENDTLKVLVESRKLSPDSLATMLVRKSDWHDTDGIRFMLEHGADPNRITRWGFSGLHQAVRRDNASEIVELMLDNGADPAVEAGSRDPRDHGRSAVALAALRGRGDLLRLFERRGLLHTLPGELALVAACARNDAGRLRSLAEASPALAAALLAQGGPRLVEFTGVGNTDGVRLLLELGVEVSAPYLEDDVYWDVGPASTALHVAAWRARHDTLRLLIERGAPVDTRDAKGRTPLALAVRACVDSYWTAGRSPDSVRALLQAGASPDGVLFPSGYAEVDALLREAAG